MGVVALSQLNRFVTIRFDRGVACRSQRGLPATDFRKRLIKCGFGARGSVAIGIAAESQMVRCLKK
jgi:hypothetical protein